ncbi:serine/threonine protein kinase [Candidatus Uabimicrobium sp. HlEnr_7]|uniref:serine/threonine protein kinase n=1 Tax=Candidatus Uabimicrobium helgolandensis TaxID=3095367 RepID=UPI0035589FC5
MKIYKAKCECGCSIRMEMREDFSGQIFCGSCKKLIMSTLAKKNLEENLQRIGNYLLLKILGYGCAGNVYLAYRDDDGIQVALKMLENVTEEIATHFQQDIQIISRLHHPNLIKIKDFGKHNGKLYFVMEYLQGETLDNRLKREILPARRTLKIAYYILDALSYSHRKGIIHRDVKPSNLYITKEGLVKVIDLGIAKIIGKTVVKTTRGEILGNIEYTAPEQIQNANQVTIHSDIYSVGATMFHCLCGKPPYAEYNNNLMDIFNWKSRNKYISLRDQKPGLPPAVLHVVEKAMSHNPQDRYKSCDEMKEEIYELITILPK